MSLHVCLINPRFVTNVIEANAEEMAWLRAARNTGTDAELKSQAQKMLSDHEQMDSDMRAYANKKNISLENVDTTEDVELNEKAGNEWDEESFETLTAGIILRDCLVQFDRLGKKLSKSKNL